MKGISADMMSRLKRKEVIDVYKGDNEFSYKATLEKYPGVAYAVSDSVGYALPRYVMHMVKDSSVT